MISKGDRVRVYATLFGVKAESKGKVIEIREDGALRVSLDREARCGKRTYPRLIWAHPKQCRKLKRKPGKRLRRVWLSVLDYRKEVPYYEDSAKGFRAIPGKTDVFTSKPSPSGMGFIEFVEVRPKKGGAK